MASEMHRAFAFRFAGARYSTASPIGRKNSFRDLTRKPHGENARSLWRRRPHRAQKHSLGRFPKIQPRLWDDLQEEASRRYESFPDLHRIADAAGRRRRSRLQHADVRKGGACDPEWKRHPTGLLALRQCVRGFGKKRLRPVSLHTCAIRRGPGEWILDIGLRPGGIPERRERSGSRLADSHSSEEGVVILCVSKGLEAGK